VHTRSEFFGERHRHDEIGESRDSDEADDDAFHISFADCSLEQPQRTPRVCHRPAPPPN
jgi:hypothetical protein